jgi:hypothetical protein
VIPAFSIVSDVTVVMLTGSVIGSAGSFCAVTVIGGSVTFGGADCPLWDGDAAASVLTMIAAPTMN